MPIDPNIALGFKLPQAQIQNPVAQYAQAQELGLNALRMQEAQQGMEVRNRLRALDPNSPEYLSEVSRLDPKLGLELEKGRATIQKEKTLGAKSVADLETTYMKNARDSLAPISDQKTYDIWRQKTIQNLPGLSQIIPAQFTPEVKLALISDANDYLKRTVPSADARTLAKAQIQETEFEKKLGAGQAERILKSREAAEDAAAILQTNEVGRNILNSGAITGAGADFFVGLNQALKTAGIDFGYADAAANSQAYAAAMGQNTAKLIKQFGAGTGLSDADREYATKIAGGLIKLDEKAIREILRINDEAARNIITKYNKSVEGVKTNIPLKIEAPGVSSAKKINTDAEYNALPSGATFIAPDGTTRRKP